MMLKTVVSLRSNLVGQKVCLKYAKQKENNSILWYSLCVVLLFGGRTYTKMRAHPVNRGCMWTDCQVPLCFRILHLIFTKCLWFNYSNCNVFFKAIRTWYYVPGLRLVSKWCDFATLIWHLSYLQYMPNVWEHLQPVRLIWYMYLRHAGPFFLAYQKKTQRTHILKESKL